MSVSEAVSRPISGVMSPSASDSASTSEDAPAAPSAGKTAALWVATLVMLGLLGALGYTKWWVPREQAQQIAQVKYEHCLEEVKVYVGKKSYPGRLAQCSSFLGG